MAWFDNPATYFDATLDANQPLSQGDLVIAPTLVIEPGLAETDSAAPTDIDVARRVTLWRAPTEVILPAAPSLSANVRWGVAMVLPHSCALEKEWNERTEELVADGMERTEAERVALEDPQLDAYISLAPAFSPDRLPEHRRASVMRGERLGIFPIPTNGTIPPSYVDFAQITTVRWELLSSRQRVAGLSKLARAHLAHRLATHFAFRAKSKIDELESAIGQKISDITTTPTAKRVTVSLILEDGSTLTLEGDRNSSAPPGRDRPARG